MMIFRKLFLFLFLLFPVLADANEITHALGDTGYMIREAMQVQAYLYDAENYYQSIRLQNEAKKFMRGDHPEGRHVQQVLDLTKQAYGLAKIARDNALRPFYLKGRGEY